MCGLGMAEPLRVGSERIVEVLDISQVEVRNPAAQLIVVIVRIVKVFARIAVWQVCRNAKVLTDGFKVRFELFISPNEI